MDFRFIDPPMPSITRYRALKQRAPGVSILRAMEYEALSKIEISGNVLDFGGGRNASGGQNSTYTRLLPDDLDIVSVNIDEQYNPTHIVPPGEPLPFDDNSFDSTLCLNVLEHIYDTRFVLDQMFRTLKPGGTLHVSVPFIFRVHGHPDDYSRHTSSWWRETMERTGFSSMTIQPLVWGKSTAAMLIRGNGMMPAVNRWRAVLSDVAVARLTSKSRTHFVGRNADRAAAVASGWQMAMTK